MNKKMDEDFRENASGNFANSLLTEILRTSKMDEEFRENARENFANLLLPETLSEKFKSKTCGKI